MPNRWGELRAALVGLIGDLDHRRSDLQSGPRRQVGRAQIEVDDELVSREWHPLGGTGDEFAHPGVHQIELHVGVCSPVRGTRRTAMTPVVADQTLVGVQLALLQHDPLILTRALDHQVERAAGRR